jgi:hypothetical protein
MHQARKVPSKEEVPKKIPQQQMITASKSLAALKLVSNEPMPFELAKKESLLKDDFREPVFLSKEFKGRARVKSLQVA